MMIGIAVNGFAFTLPVMGLLAAGVTGLAGWCLGLAITRHPLLAHFSLAVKDMPFAVPRPDFLRRVETMRSVRKSV
jgi:hypothetical protein